MLQGKELSPEKRGGTKSWILYDWANSSFALMVQTAIFPIFFKSDYLAGGLGEAESTYWLGISASIASLLVAVSAPFLGAIGDLGGLRKKMLGGFLIAALLSTAGIYLLGQGQWKWASVLYIVGVAGFGCSNIFYDALLPSVSHARNRHRVSAQGFAAGYFGGTLPLLLAMALIEGYETFGFESKLLPTRLSFFIVALWWGLFSIPLFLNVPEGKSAARKKFIAALRQTPKEVWQVVKKALQYRPVWIFLLAYWFYIDGVNTIIKMASALGADLGFGTGDLILAILLVQLVGVPFALAGGWMGQRFGARLIIICGVLIYVLVTFYASFMTAEPVTLAGVSISPLYLMAIGIGMAQGTVQSLSRSLFASIIPEEEAAAFFGLYNIVGKSAAVLGPLLVGVVTKLTGTTQSGILSIVILFAIGLGLLAFMPKTENS